MRYFAFYYYDIIGAILILEQQQQDYRRLMLCSQQITQSSKNGGIQMTQIFLTITYEAVQPLKMVEFHFIPVRSVFASSCRSECATAPPLHPHWRKLRCHPITAAVGRVLHLTRSAQQKTHVCAQPKQRKIKKPTPRSLYGHV